ncbi:hypothetical protein [Gryllotalpicola protaetiae]|uniref:hypothetical protein n=1 Tax=Gryllotalpicola protaetiae TaxID=2419771 RepID=UPI0013C44C0E|nr:hypothetical protein [Gryllotalpicola protaetiae]
MSIAAPDPGELRIFILDTGDRDSALRGGLICVTGSANPTPGEKAACVDIVSRYAMDGWAVAADPRTSLGRLAARTAFSARVPFLALTRVAAVAAKTTTPATIRRIVARVD